MTQRLRLFVAVFPPPNVVGELAAFSRGLAAEISLRAVGWTLPEQIHLTLHFLGGVERGKVSEYELALEESCRSMQSIPMQVRGLGCFPNAKRPRILWAGLQGDLDSLSALKQRMEPVFCKLGYVPEDRAFHPHLTLGRVKTMNGRDLRRAAAILEKNREMLFGEWRIDRVDLVQSVLASSGARYTILKSFKLNKLNPQN